MEKSPRMYEIARFRSKMTNIVHIGGRVLSMRRRSTKTSSHISPVQPRRNRSASDSVVHERRHQRALTDRIEIYVELRNLRNIATRHVVCTLYENDEEDEKKWRIHSSSEPQSLHGGRIEFLTSFTVDYIFERAQLIKIEIRSCSSRSSFPVVTGDIIGSAIFKLDELIGAFGAQLCKPLCTKPLIATVMAQPYQAPPILPGDFKGTVIVKGRLTEKAEPVFLQFGAKNLGRKGFFDETQVYFQLFRVEDNDERTFLYQSEFVKSHSHPIWKTFSLQMKKIADNRNRLLEVNVMYSDEVDKRGMIGTFLTSYAKMKYGPGPENCYNVVNPKKQSKKGYVNSGKFELIKFTDVSFYSFLDYVTSGTQLHLAVAVDFSSRGEAEPHSNFDSDLQFAVRAIGGIIRDYSPNKLFPSLGFGAKVPPAFYDSQEFCMNFDTDPCCRGIDGVLEAYRKASRTVVPIDKACYSHVIYYVSKLAENAGAKGLHYYVLVIFTKGGPIGDMKETLSALMHSSHAPLSVIFIGVGDGDFEEFYKMVDMGTQMRASGKHIDKDTVEFIELNSIIEREVPSHENKARIAELALHNVPRQMVSFMHKNNIAAKPPIQISRSPIFHASYLIPDRPTEFIEDYIDYDEGPSTERAKSSTPLRQRPLSERRSALHMSVRKKDTNDTERAGKKNWLGVRSTPCRSHSAIQTSREQFQQRIAQQQARRREIAKNEVANNVPTVLIDASEANFLRAHAKAGRTPSDFH